MDWSSTRVDEVVAVDLSEDEWKLLWEGLHQWGGPSTLTDALAVAMGFASVDDFFTDEKRIRRAIIDWDAVSPWDDEWTIRVLRGLQAKFAGLHAHRRHEPELDVWAGALPRKRPHSGDTRPRQG